MKHLSLVKLIAALLICNIYIFTCSVSGRVTDPEPEADETQNSQYSDEEMNGLGGTVDFIGDDNLVYNADTGDFTTVDLVNLGFAKPTFVQKPVNSSYIPTSSVKELAGQAGSSSSSTSTLPPLIVSMPDPEPVSEPPEETSSDPETSVDPDTSDDPVIPNPPNTDAANEILRVSNGSEEISGNAVDIVTKIVENEIGSTFAPEAIKAHAVTTYTYVKYHNLRGKAPYCLMKNSTNSSVRTLVESVIGEGIYYNDNLIQAVYCASSAGSTLSSKDVWGGDLPYLQRVYCELDEDYDPNYGVRKTFTSSDMKKRMRDKANISLSGDPDDWFEIESRICGKYVDEMTIGGEDTFIDEDGDTLKITGRRFREIIMDFDIRSAAFDIDYNPDTDKFTVTTYGYGHGVGLSQNGANNLAKQWGWDYKKILEFYFTGTEVY